MILKYDIGIIGGGPAGCTAALHYRKKGYSVVVFEKDMPGGVCLNRGCIPTKAIMHSAEVFDELKQAQKLGINLQEYSLDFSTVMARKDDIVSKLRKNLERTLKNAGIVLINTQAHIVDKNKISARSDIYECNKIICATGSKPKQLMNGLEFNHTTILSSDDVLNLNELPHSITIIGSGAIGIEWARIFASFGVEVFVIEACDNLLPIADFEVSKRIERIFKAKNIQFFKSAKIKGVNISNICEIELIDGKIIHSDKILVAIGRTPVLTEKIDGIEYIGDVCGQIQLAHFATKQAIELTDGVSFEKNLVPSVIYGNPEIAWVGKREQDLTENTYKKSFMLISALGKSHCDEATDGFIKLLVQNEKIVGAHIISKEAASLIQQIVVAMQHNITVDKLKEVCFAHPTYSEGIFESLFLL